MKWSEVAQSCPTLCDPMDCSLQGSSIHGIFHARVLEWIAISFSRGSSQPRDWTSVSHIAGRGFTVWATKEAPREWRYPQLKVRSYIQITSILNMIFFEDVLWARNFCHEFYKMLRQASCHAMLSCFSHVRLFATLWTVAHQSMGFSRQEFYH